MDLDYLPLGKALYVAYPDFIVHVCNDICNQFWVLPLDGDNSRAHNLSSGVGGQLQIGFYAAAARLNADKSPVTPSPFVLKP